MKTDDFHIMCKEMSTHGKYMAITCTEKKLEFKCKGNSGVIKKEFENGGSVTITLKNDGTVKKNESKIISEIYDLHNITKEYLYFLVLKFTTQDHMTNFLSPSYLIDQFWHLHILDTFNYYQFCNVIFGSMIHHDPNDINNENNYFYTLFDTAIDPESNVYLSEDYLFCKRWPQR